jgi:hypothetical protein
MNVTPGTPSAPTFRRVESDAWVDRFSDKFSDRSGGQGRRVPTMGCCAHIRAGYATSPAELSPTTDSIAGATRRDRAHQHFQLCFMALS